MAFNNSFVVYTISETHMTAIFAIIIPSIVDNLVLRKKIFPYFVNCKVQTKSIRAIPFVGFPKVILRLSKQIYCAS